MKPVSFQMKVSLACSAVILLAGAWGSRIKEQASQRGREKSLAIRAGQASSLGETPATRKRPSTAKPETAAFDFANLLEVVTRTQHRMATGEKITPEEHEREKKLAGQIRALEPSELEDFISRILSHDSLRLDLRRLWAGRAFEQLALSDPDKSLDLLAAHKAAYAGSPVGARILAAITGDGALKNADQAFARLERFTVAHPEFNHEEAVKGAVWRVMQENPELFYKLLPKQVEPLGADAVGYLLKSATTASDTNEKCLPIVVYLRDYLPRVADPQERKRLQKDILGSMVFDHGERGYDTTQRWMKEMALSRDEVRVAGLYASDNCRPEETGKWLEWIGREQPFESLAEGEQKEWYNRVTRLIGSWVDSDSQSVGRWIETQEPGKLRDRSVSAYIFEICGDNPKTAAEWVPLLTREDARRYMLGKIREHGRFGSREEAEAFVLEHGLK